ncbi:BlaI/MecI/CopY family transcriptional regulator [Intestinibacillus massiliensis]|uniref:BlaI/MecI/CopY family transcriptional regulator n=1 Tax=Intestinibacillus massiliensis TaxID=1871029 RepID=UPI000B36279C|nr:BlaI/MecI/CopY family transcriptional regulator [Intestinibacillus massiliensis]MCB6366122.1 BlaI/MecI/CopY family transcriptional regulator [Intestinibacillus massiliensis]
MHEKLFDSELRVMDVLWREGDQTAKHISDVLKEAVGWNMNTTYTVIKRLIGKGAVERREPNFLCHALVEKAAVQAQEADALVDRIFDGAADKLFASLVGSRKLSADEIENLKRIVRELE